MRSEDKISAYIEAVKKEITMVISRLDSSRKISQIHYGGGSPTSIPVKYIRELNEFLLFRFETIENPEIAIECHPGYLSINDWQELSHSGFTRFSLGIQDFDEKVLKSVNRRPSLIGVDEIVSLLRDAGAGVNMDFIYGLPHQTPDSFAETISKGVNMSPDRVVTFSYAHVPWVNKLMLQLEKEGLPDNMKKAAIFESAKNILSDNGYKTIGIDHFVKENDELYVALQERILHRNFQGYCTRRTTGQVYAFGVTAISQLTGAYVQNTKDIDKYINDINSGTLSVAKGYILNSDEQITGEVIAALMCNGKADWNYLSSILNIGTEEIKAALNYDINKLNEFVNDGLINLDENKIEVLPQAAGFVRNVAASLDKLLINSDKSFSKPV